MRSSLSHVTSYANVLERVSELWIKTQPANNNQHIINSAHIVEIVTVKLNGKYFVNATLNNQQDVELGRYQGFQVDAVTHKLMNALYNREATFIMPEALDVPTPSAKELEDRTVVTL